MRLIELRLESLRCFEAAAWSPQPGMNWLVGPNGAGKTTVLEAVHLLSHGRSFRRGSKQALLRRGSAALTVHCRFERGGRARAAGFRRGARGFEARVDDRPVDRLGDLFRAVAAIAFDPGSHALVDGPAEERRAFLDWGVFHVEPGFLDAWRSYARALRQRNVLLKQGAGDAEFEAWEFELARHGESIQLARSGYLGQLAPRVAEVALTLVPELGAVTLQLEPGWTVDVALDEALAARRGADRQRGFTTLGPHRADWRIAFEAVPHRDQLSRGQGKLAALCALFGQAACWADREGEWPMLLLDDLPSELDRPHLERVLAWVAERPLQALLTTTHVPPAGGFVFHVEPGRGPRSAD